MSKIVLAGGSGFLGQTLSHHLEEGGKEVVILGRSGQSAARGISGRFVEWDAKSLGSWQEELEELKPVQPCGRSVDCRYDERNGIDPELPSGFDPNLQKRCKPVPVLRKSG